MTEYAIRVEGLCKEYMIGRRDRGYRTFRESITDAIAASLSRLLPFGEEQLPEERLWALKDVSFDVKEGEVVGIIGRNGAGKSTLLKILSRITDPTRGRVEIHGRVVSLLEVGTGFHPELTGRENIDLNGAILGMSRAEMRAKFDDIVAFSEIEKFLDMPVKRYSSGMYMRLAFAVAAHLEPEILVVDEVLAVGDAEFQKKCIGKMKEVGGQGRTVLFVSHNMATLRRLCSRAILLEGGKKENDGPTDSVTRAYVGNGAARDVYAKELGDGYTEPRFRGCLRLTKVEVGRRDEFPANVLTTDDEIHIRIQFEVLKPIRDMRLSIRLMAGDDVHVLNSTDADVLAVHGRHYQEGRFTALCVIPANLLSPRTYSITLAATTPERVAANVQDVLSFTVNELSGPIIPTSYGVVRPLLDWKLSSYQ